MAGYAQSVLYTDPYASKSEAELLPLYDSHAFALKQLHPQAGTTVAVRKLAGWRDPTTLPQSKTDCVKDCHITPWDTFCCGWAVRWRYMDCELFVEVKVAKPQDIVTALEDCLKEAALTAAVAGIVTAIMTGGSGVGAAEEAFVVDLKICLAKKLSDIVGVRVYEACGWSDWS
ncbi:hypothetical protein [Paraburkholderia bannensis]|uniref:hypothetical protein n=1 Tax=Paraburkholderia bannensis TaxID=765414 RepID=UPI002AB6B436|nr:hypothetical protein [Paraburkholderia bannensis]